MDQSIFNKDFAGIVIIRGDEREGLKPLKVWGVNNQIRKEDLLRPALKSALIKSDMRPEEFREERVKRGQLLIKCFVHRTEDQKKLNQRPDKYFFIYFHTELPFMVHSDIIFQEIDKSLKKIKGEGVYKSFFYDNLEMVAKALINRKNLSFMGHKIHIGDTLKKHGATINEFLGKL